MNKQLLIINESKLLSPRVSIRKTIFRFHSFVLTDGCIRGVTHGSDRRLGVNICSRQGSGKIDDYRLQEYFTASSAVFRSLPVELLWSNCIFLTQSQGYALAPWNHFFVEIGMVVDACVVGMLWQQFLK